MFILKEMNSNNFLKSIKIDGVDVSISMTHHISQAMVLDSLEDCNKLFEVETLPLKRSTWTVFKLDTTAVNTLNGSDANQFGKLTRPQIKSIQKSIKIVEYVLYVSFTSKFNAPPERSVLLGFIKDKPKAFGYVSYKNIKRAVRDNIGISLEELISASDDYCLKVASDISDLKQKLIEQEGSYR